MPLKVEVCSRSPLEDLIKQLSCQCNKYTQSHFLNLTNGIVQVFVTSSVYGLQQCMYTCWVCWGIFGTEWNCPQTVSALSVSPR